MAPPANPVTRSNRSARDVGQAQFDLIAALHHQPPTKPGADTVRSDRRQTRLHNPESNLCATQNRDTPTCQTRCDGRLPVQ